MYTVYTHTCVTIIEHYWTGNYLYSIGSIIDAWCRWDNRQGLVFLEAVSQQTVDGTVVIVSICL